MIQYWQLCPKCNGTGNMVSISRITNSTHITCDVCKGAMIISTLTGLPPDYEANRVMREKIEQDYQLIDKTKVPNNNFVREYPLTPNECSETKTISE